MLDKRLETDRLILRRLSLDDSEGMFEYTSIDDVSKYLSWNVHTDIVQTREYIKTVIDEYNSNSSYVWAIELKEFKKFIGVVRIFDISYGNRRGEMSYILNPKYQGKGFIIEAIREVIDFCFTMDILNRIQARCTPDNLASERVMQKLGMRYEGLLIEYWIYKGVPTDAKLYALTRREYYLKIM